MFILMLIESGYVELSLAGQSTSHVHYALNYLPNGQSICREDQVILRCGCRPHRRWTTPLFPNPRLFAKSRNDIQDVSICFPAISASHGAWDVVPSTWTSARRCDTCQQGMYFTPLFPVLVLISSVSGYHSKIWINPIQLQRIDWQYDWWFRKYHCVETGFI